MINTAIRQFQAHILCFVMFILFGGMIMSCSNENPSKDEIGKSEQNKDTLDIEPKMDNCIKSIDGGDNLLKTPLKLSLTFK